MPHSSLPKPEFRQETRLGIVLYGGVSLAIYMNGICREFYNAVRGRGIYKLVKALTDSDIVVDILSGTSAGGINGVLLGYALANSDRDWLVEFGEFGELWRNTGDIGSLMHKPDPSQPNQTYESVLDGEDYYQKCLAQAFRTSRTKNEHQGDEWLSPFGELDLFITGTDVLGRIYQVFDSTGCSIQVKDHRTVFLLKHRAGRKEPFKVGEANPEALAKLCRITSCFPVAFPVVTVDIESNGEDANLVIWGQLKKRLLPPNKPKEGYLLHFVDGGVLDNRPFSYAIKEMYYRTAYRPVERKLFYIDPSPDRFLDSPSWQNMERPNVGKVAKDCLVGMPRYESIGNDLEQIREHNERVRRYKYQLAAVEGWGTQVLSQIVAPYSSLRTESAPAPIGLQEEIYLRSRMVSLRDRVLPLIFRTQASIDNFEDERQKIIDKVASILTKYVTNSSEREQRLKLFQAFANQIRNLDVEYALRKHFFMLQKICGLLKVPGKMSVDDERRVSLLLGKLGRQIKLLEVIRAALEQFLESYSVSSYFYDLVRKYESGIMSESDRTEVAKHLSSGEESTPDVSTPLLSDTSPEERLRDRIYSLLLRLHRFLLDTEKPDILETGSDNFVTELLEGLNGRAGEGVNIEADNLEDEIKQWLPQEEINTFYKKLQERGNCVGRSQIEEIANSRRYQQTNIKDENYSETYRSMLRTIELASEMLISNSGLVYFDKLLEEFKNYRNIDQLLYSSEYLTGVIEKELVELVRISPHDAKLGYSKGKKSEEKLCGDVFGAFGGFFKKSWRSNDILWGRLDGLNRIVETLVTPESVRHFPHFVSREAHKAGLQEAEYIKELVRESFPLEWESQSQSIGRIERLLLLLWQNPEDAEQVTKLVELLVEVGHEQIVERDVDVVIEDAVSDQKDWNEQRSRSKKDSSSTYNSPPLPHYDPIAGYFDPLLTPLGISELAKQSFSNINRKVFFAQHYKVGSETISNTIPSIVLVKLATRATLILRDMGVNLYQQSKNRRGSLLSKSGFLDSGLQAFYRFFNTSIQVFNWWVQSRNPAILQTQALGKLLMVKLLIQFAALLVILVAIIVAIPKLYALVATQVPLQVWAIAVIIAIIVYWAIYLSGRRK